MKVITIRTQIRELPDRLKRQWQRPDGSWKGLYDGRSMEKLHAAIAALDPERATLKDVNTILDPDTWWVEALECDECGELVEAIVQLGDEPGYESSTANVCIGCLRKALDMARFELDTWSANG